MKLLFIPLFSLTVVSSFAQTRFTADFRDGSLSDFMPRTGTDSWINQEQTLVQTQPTGVQWAALHILSLNQTLTGRFRIRSGEQGFVGWLLRMNLAVTDSTGQLSGSYLQVGYDQRSRQFHIIEQEERTEPRRLCFASPQPVTLRPDVWHSFAIRASFDTLTLHVDGREAARATGLRHRTYGRMALFTRNATARFDDLTLDSPEGRVEAGVISYDSFLEKGIRGESAFCRTKPGSGLASRLLRLHEGQLSESFDNGLTWSPERPAFAGLGSVGGTPQLLCTHTGRLVSIRAFGRGRPGTAHWADSLRAVVSDDEGRTWRTTGLISETRVAIMADVLREVKLPDGRHRIFLFLNNERLPTGNVQRVIYSDDDGETWQRASPSWPAAYPNEGKVVDWGEGRLRIIARPRGKLTWQGRNDTPCVDCVAYCESTDGGLTWGAWACFDIPTNTTSLNAREDPSDPDKIYLVWNYNLSAHEPNSCGPQEVSPRTRQALARYSKRTGHWEYIMDVDDWEYPSYAGPVTQDSRYMNHTLFIDKEYIYIDIHRANAYAQSCHFEHKTLGYEGTYFLRKAKKDIVPYPAFPPLHYARNGIIPGLSKQVTGPTDSTWTVSYDSTLRNITVRCRPDAGERAERYEIVAYKGQRIVKEVSVRPEPVQVISLTDLPEGSYYIQLVTNRRRLTRRLTQQLFP